MATLAAMEKADQEQMDSYGLPKVRQSVVKALEHAFASQDLEEADYETRLEKVYEAQTISELRLMISDFPNAAQIMGTPIEQMEGHASPLGQKTPTSNFILVGDRTFEAAFLGKQTLKSWTVIGDVTIDFCSHRIDSGYYEIAHHSLIGDTTLLVPAGTKILNSGLSVVGDILSVAKGGTNVTSGLTILLKGIKLIGDVKIIYC